MGDDNLSGVRGPMKYYFTAGDVLDAILLAILFGECLFELSKLFV